MGRPAPSYQRCILAFCRSEQGMSNWAVEESQKGKAMRRHFKVGKGAGKKIPEIKIDYFSS